MVGTPLGNPENGKWNAGDAHGVGTLPLGVPAARTLPRGVRDGPACLNSPSLHPVLANLRKSSRIQSFCSPGETAGKAVR